MDAISFVMGERTSSLRVRRLNELTHGASVGKPLSLPVTVTATFKEVNVHNPEGEHNGEVQFTRAIRGNSSEYVVNGKVRLNENNFCLNSNTMLWILRMLQTPFLDLL